MNNYNFENVSVVGRIAYGIMCAEEYLTHKYPNKDWAIVFKYFWKITELELWDDWMSETIEIIPEYLFEFDNYELSDFEFLTKNKYLNLKKVYANTYDDVNAILKMVYDLANSHSYSSISGKGEESLFQLEKIIVLLENEGIALPNDKEVKTHLISERKGWGEPFNGMSLSKVVK